MSDALLEIKNLKTYFYIDEGISKAVGGVDLVINRGEILGVIGESGSGKSVTALSVIQLVAIPPGKIVSGEIWFEGKNLLKMSLDEIRRIRGNKISMIFQEPMTSLNPVLTIGNQIIENIVTHQKLDKPLARERAIDMLSLVGIPSPGKRIDEYPHQLSGGMRQRAMIAMALSCRPKLLITDEPTTALDVTIQAQILELIRKMRKEIGMAVMMITHDLAVIAEVADNVVVAYGGKVMEYGDVISIFKDPLHPYTKALYNSIPRITDSKKRRLEVIDGLVPNPLELPEGCSFHPRCKFARRICKQIEPELVALGARRVRCLMYDPAYQDSFKTESGP
ncbi:MAG: ABC transporter ATP-binding protein [Thermodesulfobacteriota bacterium]|nr:ABC transporter ATP-binding protein [Thermodesulfobacteriota bacterium]